MEKLILWISQHPGTFVAVVGGALMGALGGVLDASLDVSAAQAEADKTASEAPCHAVGVSRIPLRNSVPQQRVKLRRYVTHF